MDRVSRNHRGFSLILFLMQWAVVFVVAMGLVATLASPISAGVILLPPPVPASPTTPDERFPESRFGSPPSPPDLGGPHATVSIEESFANRAPAGLEFSRDTGQVQARPVVSEEGMPATTANQNPKPNATQRSGVQEVALIAGDLGFFPKTLFVTRDIPVRMYVTGASKKALCLMLDSFQIRKQVRSQKVEEISFTPTTPGQFRFYCPVNGMEGTLLVRELATIVNGNNADDNSSRAPASVQTPSRGSERESE